MSNIVKISHEIIKQISSKKKPVILATGASKLEEVKEGMDHEDSEDATMKGMMKGKKVNPALHEPRRRSKNSRIGRNPKTKEEKEISKRDVVLFKPSKEFKDLLNNSGDNAA